jgi:hypothetical protein
MAYMRGVLVVMTCLLIVYCSGEWRTFLHMDEFIVMTTTGLILWLPS